MNSKAVSGSTEKNPYYFNHCGVQSVALYCNGKLTTNAPLEMDFSKNIYSKAYHHFYEALGKLNGTDTNSITKPEFKVGYCLFPFILSATQILDTCGQLPIQGTLRLELKFSSAPSESLTLISYAEYDASLVIDANGNASTYLH